MANSTVFDDRTSNSDDQTATIAVGGLVIAVATITVMLRLYVRISTRVGLGWDDGLILAAVVVTLLTAVLILWGIVVSCSLPSPSECEKWCFLLPAPELANHLSRTQVIR